MIHAALQFSGVEATITLSIAAFNTIKASVSIKLVAGRTHNITLIKLLTYLCSLGIQYRRPELYFHWLMKRRLKLQEIH